MSPQDIYELPPADRLRELAITQDAKEKEIRQARSKQESSDRQAAAELIQVTFAYESGPLSPYIY